MCYEQEQYEAEMGGAGEAEAQAAGGYEDYLEQILQAEDYHLYVLEVAIDMLSSTHFKKSGLSAVEYLSERKKQHIKAGEPKPEPVGQLGKERVPGICGDCGAACSINEIYCDSCCLPF